MLYTTLASTHQCCSLLTRLLLVLHALYYTGKHTPMPQSTHTVISCSACFILHWQARTNAAVYSQGYFLFCMLYTTLARTRQCHSLFTRLFLALTALYYTGKDTPMPQSTHEVISCSDCFILHWQGHTNATVYSRGYFLLWLLYTTLARTHQCHSLLTRLFLALIALYYTGKDTPMPQSTHEVISCSASFMAAVAFSVTLKSSRLGGLTSAAGKLPWTSFPLVTEDGNHDTKASIQVFLQTLQVDCHGHPPFWSHKTAIMNHDTKASIQVFLQMLQVSCHGHPSFWSHETAIRTPRHSYRCFYNWCR